MKEETVLITIHEASLLSGIGENTIRTAVKQPYCPYVFRIGNRYMIKKNEFLKYIHENTYL